MDNISASDREHLLSNNVSEVSGSIGNAEIKCETKVFRRRWYIALLFSAIASLQAGVWNTWGPVSDAAKFAFGWTDATIALLGNWGPIPYVFTAFLFSWLVDVKGLRFTMVLTSFFVWSGTGVRCITPKQPYVTWLMHTGQFLNGIAGPIAMAAPPLISSVWFPARQRSAATGLMFSLTFVCMALSFILGPIAVPSVSDDTKRQCSNHSVLNITHANCSFHKHKVQQDIMLLMYCEFGVVCFFMLMVVIYFPSKPPKPPSISASIPRIEFKQGMKELSRHYRFWILAIAYGLCIGTQGGWSAVIDLILEPLGVSEITAGWLGFSGMLCSQVGILGAALLASVLARRMRLILLTLFFLATLSYTAFSVASSGWFDMPVVPILFVTNCLGSFFTGGNSPLFYELSCESAYPVNEGLTAMVITWLVNVFGLVFLAVPMIPHTSTKWMNWSLAASCALCIPALFFYKETYRRLDIDTMVINVDEAGSPKSSEDMEEQTLEENIIHSVQNS